MDFNLIVASLWHKSKLFILMLELFLQCLKIPKLHVHGGCLTFCKLHSFNTTLRKDIRNCMQHTLFEFLWHGKQALNLQISLGEGLHVQCFLCSPHTIATQRFLNWKRCDERFREGIFCDWSSVQTLLIYRLLLLQSKSWSFFLA